MMQSGTDHQDYSTIESAAAITGADMDLSFFAELSTSADSIDDRFGLPRTLDEANP